MFRFENNTYLLLLILVPILLGFFLYSLYVLRRRRKLFADLRLLEILNPNHSVKRKALKFTILLLCLVSLILAIANPQFGSKMNEIKSKGIEVVIALDISNSMLARDIEPSRLEAAKMAIAKLTDKLGSDKLGLIVFAGDAYVQIPITNDYSAIKMYLDQITPNLISKQGTALSTAINFSVKSFSQDEKVSKALIIITDGEDHEPDAVETAKNVAEQGIRIYTIGMGLVNGAPIPISGTNDFKKDKDGNVVISKLNEKVLEDLAASGNGRYIRANNQIVGLDALYNELNSLEKIELSSNTYSEFDNKFQIPLWCALFLLVIDLLILERKNKYFKRIKLFKKL